MLMLRDRTTSSILRTGARGLAPFATAMLGMLSLAGVARADDPVLINAAYYVDVHRPGAAIEQHSPVPISAALGTISAGISNAHGGTVTSHLEADSIFGTNQYFEARAIFAYSLQLVPLTADAPTDINVPIHFTAAGSAVAESVGADHAIAQANISVSQNGALLGSAIAVDNDHTSAIPYPESFTLDRFFDVSTASLLQVWMETDIVYNTSWSGHATGSAWVDPTFTIDDPYWASLYKIVGIPFDATEPPPSSDAPEPASWAMMVGGFGLVGSAMRRRQTRVGFA